MVEYDDIDNSEEGYRPPFGVDFLGMAERSGFTFPKPRSLNDWTLNQDSRRKGEFMKHKEMEVNEKEGGKVDFLMMAIQIGYTFPVLRRCNDSDTSLLDNDDTRPASTSSPSFSIGLSQDEILNNVALLSPSATVDHNIEQRIFLDIISNEAKDEHVDKKEDQEGELIPKDDKRANENVHEEAYEQSDSEKTISASLVQEPCSSSIIRDVDTARLVCDYIYTDFVPESPFYNEEVFMYKGISATRFLFQSLKPRNHVSSTVIDCWSAYLNHQEMAKSDPSPLRFYTSTLVVSVLLNTKRKKKTKKHMYTSFKSIMKQEFKLFSTVPLKSIDMFFFPVASNEHFYLIVYDSKTCEFYIIDNWLSKAKVKNRYGNTPTYVAEAFVKFLKENSITYSKGDDVCSLNPVVVKMPWKTSKNLDDCGVFTMRHMETFTGDPSWECGLKKDEIATLDKLRDTYVSTLILFKENHLSEEIPIRAKAYHKLIQRFEQKHIP